MINRRSIVWSAAVALLLFAAPLTAQETLVHRVDAAGALAFWTEAQLAAAEPMSWKISDRPAGDPATPEERGAGLERVWPSSPPVAAVPRPAPMRLFQPPADAAGAAVETRDSGTSKFQFSSSRLVPLDVDLFYPYVTVGKLFFTIPGIGNASCTAAVIARRLILTAGHCIHSGTASPGFFTNWVFVPAFRDGVAPIGLWPANAAIVHNAWALGGGTVPNPVDFGILELDELLFTDGNFYPIGDVLGNLGLKINALKQNHVHIFGYPNNLDGGNKMHQVTTELQKFTAGTNTTLVGSDMMQGSSGGPWVQNFGERATGQGLKGGSGQLNLIVGVTSFGPLSKKPKQAGSSMPDNRFVAVLNGACGITPGNC